MRKVLSEVQDGSFAKEFISDNENNQAKMKELRESNQNHPIEKVGSELRKMMSWVLKANKK